MKYYSIFNILLHSVKGFVWITFCIITIKIMNQIVIVRIMDYTILGCLDF